MGQTADQLRDQVDQTRDDASQKIEQIEHQMSQTAEKVKEQLDWRHQVDERPLMAVGAAMIGGMILGGLVGGHDGHAHENHYQYQPGSAARNDYRFEGGTPRGVSGAIRNAAKASGFDETVQHVATAALSTFADRLRDAAEHNLPGLADKLHASTGQSASAATATMSDASGRLSG